MNNVLEEFVQCRPVDDVTIRAAVDALMKENDALKLAVLHSMPNKIRYSGKIEEKIFLDATCSCGEVIIFNKKRKVPWSTIKEVLRLVQEKAKILK